MHACGKLHNITFQVAGRGPTLGGADSNKGPHVYVFPEPLVDVPWQLFPALLHHDPSIQQLQQSQ